MNKFWAGKRVLITGHTGFKGSWLTIWLHALGAKVSGLSNSDERGNNIVSLDKLDGCIENYSGDINDAKFVNHALKESDPEIIIHMAAQPLVLKSYADPLGTLNINVMGTATILNELYTLKKSGLTSKVFLNVTTDKVYKNKEWVWGYREIDDLGGNDPYSCSKACSEFVTSMFAKSFFSDTDINLATARAGNVVGGGDWSENRLVPDCIKSLVKGEDIVLRRPRSVRPWQHVLEPLAGYLLLCEYLYDNDTEFESWNFGADNSYSVEQVSKQMARLWKDSKSKIITGSSIFEETNLLKINSNKAESSIGWKNTFSMDDVIEYVSEWYYRVLVEGEDSYDLSIEQLKKASKLFRKESIVI